MIRPLLGAVLAVVAIGSPPRAAQPPPTDDTLQVLAASLKPDLVTAIPEVIFEQSTNWGHQEMANYGVRIHGLHTEVRKVPKNDGVWKKVRITAQDLPHSLEFAISEFKAVDGERFAFKVLIGMQVGIDYEHQNWNLGVRQWSGNVRARMQVHFSLDCECVLRTERSKGPVPDLVFRLHATKAQIRYDHLVVEHIAGLGGSAARVLGDAIHSGLRQWKPSMERDLLARAETALVRAADTREVRIGLGGLMKKK